MEYEFLVPQRLFSVEIVNEFELSTSIVFGNVVGNVANKQLERAEKVRTLGFGRAPRSVNPLTRSASARNTAHCKRVKDVSRLRL